MLSKDRREHGRHMLNNQNGNAQQGRLEVLQNSFDGTRPTG
jgi:hypothetical protein